MNQKQVKTNDVIEELKSSMTNLTDLSKTLQSLSGRLSLIGDECQKINNVSKQLQSYVSKMQKSLVLIENQKENESIDDFWLYKQHLSFRGLLQMSNSQAKRNWSPERYENTFRKHLLELNKRASTFCHLKDVCIYQVLFNFLVYISKYNGYVYGGFVRDFLVPLIVYEQKFDDLDFKDIDIWFSNECEAEAFIKSFQQNSPKLIPDAINQVIPLEEYGCGQHFTRKKYYFCYNHVALFMVDVVIAQQLPVNDFSVNLLMFQAKDHDLTQSSLSCFSVGENPDGDYYKYSVLILIEMIANYQTDILKGYRQMSSYPIADYRHIVKSRCERMVKWGWSLRKEDPQSLGNLGEPATQMVIP